MECGRPLRNGPTTRVTGELAPNVGPTRLKAIPPDYASLTLLPRRPGLGRASFPARPAPTSSKARDGCAGNHRAP